MTPETELADRIRSDNEAWIVRDFPTIPSQVRKGKPFVSVFRPRIAPAGTVQALDHEIKLHVYASKILDEGSAEELRNIFDGVMLSIHRLEGFIFKGADLRSFANDSFAGWEIDVTASSKNVYRAAALEERSQNGSATP